MQPVAHHFEAVCAADVRLQPEVLLDGAVPDFASTTLGSSPDSPAHGQVAKTGSRRRKTAVGTAAMTQAAMAKIRLMSAV